MYQNIFKNYRLSIHKKNFRIHIFFIFFLILVNFIASYLTPYSQLFDSASFKLQLIYPTYGLKPYKDFVFIYPFGPSLISIFITKLNQSFIKPINLVWIIHLLLQLILLRKIISRNIITINKVSVLYLFLILETFIYSKFGGEPYSHLLLFITLIEFFKAYENKKLISSTFIYPTLLALFKWDRLLFCACVFGLFFILCKFKKIHISLFILLKIILLCIASFIFLLICLYIFNTDNFFNTIRYIFIDPFIIMKYRNLPFTLDENVFSIYNFYYLLILIYISLFCYLMIARITIKQLYFFCAGLSLIPPTFGRTDVGHFIPFYLSSFFLIVSLPPFFNNFLTKYFKMILSITKFISIFLIVFFIVMELRIPLLENTCGMFKNEVNPKSIFVGNSQYDNFFVNFPLLYLSFSDLKPATKYINDEPGLQNTCQIQDEILNDFNLAPRPVIFFLNKNLLIDKNNKNTYVNCGKLEEYFAKNTKILGYCSLSKNTIEVRVLDK
jgi:hypothetical protein